MLGKTGVDEFTWSQRKFGGRYEFGLNVILKYLG